MISIKNRDSYADSVYESSLSNDVIEYTFNYPCEFYYECHPYEITFFPGFYFLECWGASGSFNAYEQFIAKGGPGGYSSGVFVATKRKVLSWRSSKYIK